MSDPGLPHVLVVYEPAEGYPRGTPAQVAEALAAMPAMALHMARLGEAAARGDVLLGGPVSAIGDGLPRGGMVVFRGREAADVVAFVEDDPVVREGIERARVYRFAPAPGMHGSVDAS
ncbi:MAG TPA: YciI family protein [Frateuria sp.]|uniref:YciI family protein n=1 Tax=Frateuria sp. TaxID=2211372 RepID=UPI002D804AAE|nr:YciI family protein [Frateuria sp.]HET6805953.1 YciI family protein [Frateuria sp.]